MTPACPTERQTSKARRPSDHGHAVHPAACPVCRGGSPGLRHHLLQEVRTSLSVVVVVVVVVVVRW